MGEFALQIGTRLKWVGLGLSPLLLLPILLLILGPPLQRLSEGIIAVLDQISSATLGVAKFAAIVMVIAQLAVILARYVFGWSASWLYESVVYGFATLFLIAASSALKADAHVRVDIFRSQMSGKQKAIVDFAGLYLLLLPVCILLLWAVAGSSAFANSWASFQGSRESDGLPIYFLFRTLIPVFAVLMISQALSEALKSALIIKGLREPPTSHDLEHGAA